MLREGLDHIQTNAEHWPGEDYYTLEQVAEAKERLTFIEDLYAVACQTFGADWDGTNPPATRNRVVTGTPLGDQLRVCDKCGTAFVPRLATATDLFKTKNVVWSGGENTSESGSEAASVRSNRVNAPCVRRYSFRVTVDTQPAQRRVARRKRSGMDGSTCGRRHGRGASRHRRRCAPLVVKTLFGTQGSRLRARKSAVWSTKSSDGRLITNGKRNSGVYVEGLSRPGSIRLWRTVPHSPAPSVTHRLFHVGIIN